MALKFNEIIVNQHALLELGSFLNLLWIKTNCGKFLKIWESGPPDMPPEKFVYKSGNNS